MLVQLKRAAGLKNTHTYRNPEKFIAIVLATAHESDLALLTVESDRFWNDTNPLELTGIPELQDTVTVLGYPQGGEQLSITEGIVSRVDMTVYSHSDYKLLAIQIDAAINPGNSGGPAIVDGKVAGIAFQGFNQLQNVGYIIPVPLIHLLLEDLRLHKKYTGIVDSGIESVSMENEALRNYWGMSNLTAEKFPNQTQKTGILVVHVDELRIQQFKETINSGEKSEESNILKERNIKMSLFPHGISDMMASGTNLSVGLRRNDVLLSIDTSSIANDGTVLFRNMERLNYEYSLMEKFSGETTVATVLRDGRIQTVTMPLSTPKTLVPKHTWDTYPSYYIFGGLVFTPLTKTLVKILPSKLTVGYNFRNVIVVSVNGEKILSLQHLVNIMERPQSSEDEFLRIYIENENGAQLPIVLHHSTAKKLGKCILKEHQIPTDRQL
ncbi:serine protease [Cardiosporidium cionae]|uniref:Serine protease n=1 Tax=Cardiosporidium cionae TaxID=476202 RepID=A0ABQ7JD06_9APIC|nr:serine protease [Cardiosporidium cionae]|eukprot:KAF8821759.1 serine protease [Cardiosporidium cionae]